MHTGWHPTAEDLAGGVAAGEQMNARAASANRLSQQQRELELKRARALAREVGATSSSDIETIANSIVSPPSGTTSTEMARAYRETGPAMADASRRMGGPTRAAAIATDPSTGSGEARSFGEWAAGVVMERARMNRSAASTDGGANKRMAREPAGVDDAVSQRTQIAPSTDRATGQRIERERGGSASVMSQRTQIAASTDGAIDQRIEREPELADGVVNQPSEGVVRATSAAAPPIEEARASETLAALPTPSSVAPTISTGKPPEASVPTGSPVASPTPSSTPTTRASTVAPASSPSANAVAQAPMQALIDNPPSSWPGSPTQNASAADQWTLHDWGMGMAISFHVNADPTHAPLWGEAFSDLRRASLSDGYGEPYVRELIVR